MPWRLVDMRWKVILYLFQHLLPQQTSERQYVGQYLEDPLLSIDTAILQSRVAGCFLLFLGNIRKNILLGLLLVLVPLSCNRSL